MTMERRSVIEKYIGKMSDRNMAYRLTLIELVRRGYKRVEARKMITKSHLGDRMFNDPVVFWHYDEQRWADWVIQDYDMLHAGEAITA